MSINNVYEIVKKEVGGRFKAEVVLRDRSIQINHRSAFLTNYDGSIETLECFIENLLQNQCPNYVIVSSTNSHIIICLRCGVEPIARNQNMSR